MQYSFLSLENMPEQSAWGNSQLSLPQLLKAATDTPRLPPLLPLLYFLHTLIPPFFKVS